jgi:HEAT repeat protein
MARATDITLEQAPQHRDEALRARRPRGIRVRTLLILVAVCAGLLWARDEWERREAVAALEAKVATGITVDRDWGVVMFVVHEGNSLHEAVQRVSRLHAQPQAIWRLRLALRRGQAGAAKTNVQNAAIASLIWLGPEARSAVPDLIETLQHNPSADVHGFAAQALARVGADDSATLPALLSKLDSLIAIDVQSAIEALPFLGHRAWPAIPAITKALSHGDPNVRVAAIHSLGRLGTAAHGAVPALITLLNNREHRGWVLEALSEIAPDDPMLIPALEPLIKESDPEFMAQAELALRRIRFAQDIKRNRQARLQLIAADHKRFGIPDDTGSERP